MKNLDCGHNLEFNGLDSFDVTKKLIVRLVLNAGKLGFVKFN